MNAQTKVVAEPATVEPAYREAWREVRDRLQAEQLRSIAFRGKALRLAWAMRGLCREAEKLGLDASYWRDLARDAEGAVYD